MNPVTISPDVAQRAIAALEAAGDTDAATAIKRASMNVWVIAAWSDEDGYAAYYGEQTDDWNKTTNAFGPPSNAFLYTDAQKAQTDLSDLDTDDVHDVRWEAAPTDADIADMHENTDPDRVDEYVALANRAARLRDTIDAADLERV